MGSRHCCAVTLTTLTEGPAPLELAASIDHSLDEIKDAQIDYLAFERPPGHRRQKSRDDDLSPTMADWHRGQVQYWLSTDTHLKPLTDTFHQHQISGLTLATITKTELQNELEINQHDLCEAFILKRDKFLNNGPAQCSTDHSPMANTPRSNTPNITLKDVDVSVSQNSQTNIELEIKYECDIREQMVDITMLYNRLQQFDMKSIRTKIIDFRPYALFREKRILTSVNINLSDKYETHKNEQSAILEFDDLSIVDTNLKVPFWSHMQSFKSESILIVVLDHSSEDQQSLKSLVTQYLADVFRITDYIVLDDDWMRFYEKYSFLCHVNDTSSDEDVSNDEDTDRLFANETFLHLYPTEVISGQLYISDWKQSQRFSVLKHLGITHVLTVCDRPHENTKIGVEYKHISMIDDEKEDILQSGKLENGIAWIESILLDTDGNEKHRVLVHCTEGLSRSAAIVIGYLMKRNTWSLDVAMSCVKNMRQIAMNSGFEKQLAQYQQKLNIT